MVRGESRSAFRRLRKASLKNLNIVSKPVFCAKTIFIRGQVCRIVNSCGVTCISLYILTHSPARLCVEYKDLATSLLYMIIDDGPLRLSDKCHKIQTIVGNLSMVPPVNRLIGETVGPAPITDTACTATHCPFPSWHTDNYIDVRR